MIERLAADAPDRPVLIAGERIWSAQELLRDARRAARGMHELGVGIGDRVAVHMRNLPEAAIAYVACLLVGAVVVPLNTRFKSEEVDYWMERTTPSLYLGDAAIYSTAGTLSDRHLEADRRYVVGGGGGVPNWSELGATRTFDGEVEEEAAEAAAFLLATSGTTGRSKLVVWTRAILASLGPSAAGRGVEADDVIPLVTPLMHGSGVYYLFAALTGGATAVLIPRFDPDEMLDAIERHRCTSLFGLPYVCAGLAERQKARSRDVSSLRICTVSGDTCPPETERAFQEQFGRPLLSFWAATEDVGASTLATRPGPFFRMLPTAVVRVVEDGAAVDARDATGEMVVRSLTTTPGYWEAPGVVKPLADGFHSGDIVCSERDGEYRYVGREKDLIVRGGSNISPVEIEDLLRAHPDVVDAGVAGVPDDELGQRVGALLILRVGLGQGDSRTIVDAIRPRLADYKVPELVAVAGQIPRNRLGKVDRKAIAEALAERPPAPVR